LLTCCAGGCHVHLCLARIFYEWNDLVAAQRHSQQSFQLGQPYKERNDIVVACEVFVARLNLARRDFAGAAESLAKAEQSARQKNFVNQMPEIAAVRVLTSLLQGDLVAAAALAQKNNIPTSQARVHLAAGDPSAALAVLRPLRQQVEEKGWKDEWLKTVVGIHSILDFKRALTPDGIYVGSANSTALIIQTMLLGSWISMTGSKKMVNLMANANKEDLVFVGKLIEAGKVVPVIDRCYPLNEAAEAVRFYGEGHPRRKVVITMQHNS